MEQCFNCGGRIRKPLEMNGKKFCSEQCYDECIETVTWW
jgi:hypothetical protein